jgi:exosome complex RNA-binding protein Csl4
MKDRETVIEALQYMISENCTETQFDYTDDIEAAIVMLKEQEEATVISIHRNGFGSRVGSCPNCQKVLHYEYNQSFCGKCGQAVKWDE